jgi:hypothetical protein
MLTNAPVGAGPLDEFRSPASLPIHVPAAGSEAHDFARTNIGTFWQCPSARLCGIFGLRLNMESPMIDQVPALDEQRSSDFTFGALWRVGAVVSLIWVIVEGLGGAELRALIVVPLFVGAWLWVIFALDRWVTRGIDRTY